MCAKCRSNELPKTKSDRDQERARVNAKLETQLRTIRDDWATKGITSPEDRDAAAVKTVTVMFLADPVVAIGLASFLLSNHMNKLDVTDAKIQEG